MLISCQLKLDKKLAGLKSANELKACSLLFSPVRGSLVQVLTVRVTCRLCLQQGCKTRNPGGLQGLLVFSEFQHN